MKICDIKQHFAGREEEALFLAGIDESQLKPGGVPCPVCGGNDRFWWSKRKKIGGCRGSEITGGFIDLIAYVRGWDAGQTLKFLAEHIEGTGQALKTRTAEEVEQDKQAKAEEDRRLKARAKIKAIEMWMAGNPADPAHPYLVRKKIKPHGIKQSGNNLLVPLHNMDGQIKNLSQILPEKNSDGKDKYFLKDGLVDGLFFWIGKDADKSKGVFLVEGFATGASLYESYGRPVMVAFNAGNLLAVAKAYRDRFDDLIIICADNDRKNNNKPCGNVGLKSARKVVAEVPNTQFFYPVFPADADIALSDFNDLKNHVATNLSEYLIYYECYNSDMNGLNLCQDDKNRVGFYCEESGLALKKGDIINFIFCFMQAQKQFNPLLSDLLDSDEFAEAHKWLEDNRVYRGQISDAARKEARGYHALVGGLDYSIAIPIVVMALKSKGDWYINQVIQAMRNEYKVRKAA